MSPALPASALGSFRKDGVRILAVTGSSGGHIFPALSFLAQLKERRNDVETLLVLPKKNIKYEVIPHDYRVKQTCITSLSLRPDFKGIKGVLNFIKGWLESLFIFFEFRPDIVVGFGSLNSIPLILWAWFFRSKTLIHEQNLIPGRANRLLAKFCDKIAVSFEETKDYLKVAKNNLIFSGNPLRRQLEKVDKKEAAQFFGFDPAVFTLLVMGGSQGSSKINAVFLRALSLIDRISCFQVVHISGENDFDSLQKAYNVMGRKVKLFAFLKEMQYAYSAVDLAISRAGATAITELIFFQLPAIIIPYPFAYRHQQANAAVLKNRGAAMVIDDDVLTPQLLAEAIGGCAGESEKIKAMRRGFDGISLPDAGNVLTDAVLSLVLN